MVILFSNRKSKEEKEIIEILTAYGANYISDKIIATNKNTFTIVSEYKKTDLQIENGIAVFIDNTTRFDGQILPPNIIGICEENNHKALEIFKNSNISVITCGLGIKNTVTLSSLTSNSLLTALQRTITNHLKREIEPAEFKIRLSKSYSPFSVMASTAVLLLNEIVPKEF